MRRRGDLLFSVFMTSTTSLDCIVCGSCVVDLLCKPVPLGAPIGAGVLHSVAPMQLTAGGVTSNSGIMMSRLGLKVGIFSYLGEDAWADLLVGIFEKEGIDTRLLLRHPTEATSTTVVAIDESGERSFLHCVGAPREMNRALFTKHLDHFASARMALLGYYSLMPNLEPDLPEVLQDIRSTGCQTAMDAAGDGGTMKPLDRMLPHLDIWVPSLLEASHQTGHSDPQRIVDSYRNCGAPGLLGVKLGMRGVLLSPAAGEYVEVPLVNAPGPVVDTTGAGDSFYAGLLAGLIRGLPLQEAGQLGAAAAACCVTSMGGWTGGRSWEETSRLAGLAGVA